MYVGYSTAIVHSFFFPPYSSFPFYSLLIALNIPNRMFAFLCVVLRFFLQFLLWWSGPPRRFWLSINLGGCCLDHHNVPPGSNLHAYVVVSVLQRTARLIFVCHFFLVSCWIGGRKSGRLTQEAWAVIHKGRSNFVCFPGSHTWQYFAEDHEQLEYGSRRCGRNRPSMEAWQLDTMVWNFFFPLEG